MRTARGSTLYFIGGREFRNAVKPSNHWHQSAEEFDKKGSEENRSGFLDDFIVQRGIEVSVELRRVELTDGTV